MSGYKIRLILYSGIEVWREVEIPDNITFEKLHFLIQKLFGFDNYHMWEFRIPKIIRESDEVDLNDIERTIDSEKAREEKISDVFDKYKIADYLYDFGDGWEIIVYKLEDSDYKNKTAEILDYSGRYNPMDDIGGIFVFEEIMEAVNEGEDIADVAGEYGIGKGEISKWMDFENKYKKGSKIRL